MGSNRLDGSEGLNKRLRPRGGYRRTASFQTATLIYDATYFFCQKFLPRYSRLAEQMIHAARSGRQNIAEGSRASGASSQSELRLLNVARASLEELLLDFEDYLRHHRLPQWSQDSPEARAVREVPKRCRRDQSDLTDLTDQERWNLYARWLDHEDPGVRANAIICLIHQANFLLDRQIAALERQFIQEGGYRERLAAARLAFREKKERSDRSNPTDSTDHLPSCPRCGKPMVLRHARSGENAGRPFWGCSGYPVCKETLEL